MSIFLTRNVVRGASALAVTTLAVVVAGSLPADAHVRVKPDSTQTGTYAALTFRVPDESDTAATTKLVLTLPQDKPFGSVSVRPLPGWRVSVADAPLPTPVTVKGTTLTKAPRTVTWTATSPEAAIAPGEYQEFAISAGPLPAPGALVLPVVQTYSDGTVVGWDQVQPAGQTEEVEHPAPQFEVTAAPAASEGTDASASPSTRTVAAVADSDPVARWLAGAALTVAVAGVGFTVSRRRKVDA